MNATSQAAPDRYARNPDCSPNDYDLVRELIERQQTFRRCDQYISNSEFKGELQNFWGAIKSQESKNLERLQTLIVRRSHGLSLRLPDL